MNYELIKDVLDLVQAFEGRNADAAGYEDTINGFRRWIAAGFTDEAPQPAPDWEGKDSGRSPESVISTLLLHMSRYAKAYSRAAMQGSDFTAQEDFIYLITLKTFGAMTKMALIKKNVQEKPAGIQIINRLIVAGWAEQTDSETDRRSKVIQITPKGLAALEAQMDNIRQASRAVTGNLSPDEQTILIRLLIKLEDFHNPIYCKNLSPEMLLEHALQQKTLQPEL